MDGQLCGPARISTHDSATVVELQHPHRLLFGRDPGADLVFADDLELSRQAGEIRHDGSGVVVTNLSRLHSLFVNSLAGSIRLAPAREGAAPGAYVMVDGVFEITVRNWQRSGCRIVVEVDSVASAEQPVASPQTRETHFPLRLNPDTKEFVTALVLCKPKLQAGSATPVMPTVPELTQQILEATNSWHLLRQFNEDSAVRAQLTGRIHEHLRQLRKKLSARGLVGKGALAPPVLADVLINNDVIVPAYLALLDDPTWQTAQADRWWS
jgi:hypothetical protein